MRPLGQWLDRLGVSMQGSDAYVERLIPSTRVVPIKGKMPKHGYQNFVASNASFIGDVKVGELTTVWYGATLKGDVNSVTVGKNTAILDNAVVYSTKERPTVIGNDVTISPGATVQSADIGDGAMIGMGAVVQSGAKVGKDAFVDAGSVVAAGTEVPAGALVTGNPARQLRVLSAEEIAYLRSTAALYSNLGLRHQEQSNKSHEQLDDEEEDDLLRVEYGLEPEAPIPTVDPDVVQYYKLSQFNEKRTGLLREEDFNQAAELKAREEEELAADAAENAHYAHVARLKRVGASLKALANANVSRADTRDKIFADLDSMDPEGVALLHETVAAIGQAASSGDAEAKARIIDLLCRVDPEANFYENQDAAEARSNFVFTQVAKHAQAMAVPAGGAGVASAAAAAAAAGSSGAASVGAKASPLQ